MLIDKLNFSYKLMLQDDQKYQLILNTLNIVFIFEAFLDNLIILLLYK
jgi:hypothetical protein